MADIASTDVTVTQVATTGAPGKTWIEGSKRHGIATVAFGNGTLTYPTGGVPLPGFAKFGMSRNLDYIRVLDQESAKGYIWKYDYANKKLRCYVQGYDHGTGGSVTLDDYPITAAAGVTSGISISLTTGAGAAVGRLGPGQELLGSTDAPAATTLYVEAVGW